MKTRRIFIFGWLNFPRGSAPANYVQYFAEALSKAGYETIVISNTAEEYKLYKEEFSFKSIKILPIVLNKHKVLHYAQYKYFMAHMVMGLLKPYSPTRNDVFITYGERRSQFHNTAFLVRKKYGVKIACCVAEWLGRENFKTEKESIKYEEIFDETLTKYDLIIPISHKIEHFFARKNIATLYLPIMADTGEYTLEIKKTGKIKFIFSANGKMKDSLNSMLWGIANLPKNDQEKMEFHLTGVNIDTVRNILKNNQDLLNNTIIVHSWMKYEELISLYQETHYLLLARETSHMTESNFPSKIPEVMSYGIVPIVSRVGDYTEYYLVDGQNCLVMDGYNADICMRAIQRALSLIPEQYSSLSHNSREFAEQVFDYHNWVTTIRDGIEDLFVV